MPLAFTQEDFLVSIFFSENKVVPDVFRHLFVSSFSEVCIKQTFCSLHRRAFLHKNLQETFRWMVTFILLPKIWIMPNKYSLLQVHYFWVITCFTAKIYKEGDLSKQVAFCALPEYTNKVARTSRRGNTFRELIFTVYITSRELLQTADGGQLAIDWVHNDDSPHSHEVRPTVLILPGLTGNSIS